MSISSSSVSVTASPGLASPRSSSKVTMERTRVVRPEGRAMTSSPGRMEPETTCPANPRKSWCGRSTYCTGKRKSTALRLEPTRTVSRWCRNVGPSYQGMFSLFETTLSPSSAEMGMKTMSATSSRLAKSRYSFTTL